MFDAESFSRFIASNVNRGEFIQNYLLERNVQSAVINVDGRRHIYVKLPHSGYNATFRMKTIIAHYDRFVQKNAAQVEPLEFGANDNSFVVFCLMDFAARLVKFKGIHNVRIFFTDGEELVSSEEGVTSQGAYKLASALQKAGIKDEDIFVFDCMGRGTIPILGTSVLPRGVSNSFAKKYNALEQGAKAILASLGGGWLNLPIPYSDNAGFLASGIPAVAFTMLPQDEAQNYMYALQNIPGLLEFVQNRIAKISMAQKEALKNNLPRTWQLMHTPLDNFASITPESFSITARILDAIALRKTI